MKSGKCPNCGAPVDLMHEECSYCNSKYQIREVSAIGKNHEPAGNASSAFDVRRCLKATLSFGLFFLFSVMKRSRRR